MRIARALFSLLFLSISWQAHAKPVVAPPAVLARVRAAHRIFVSNAGEDDYLSYSSGEYLTDQDIGYMILYRELVNWPGFQLVNTPAQADLVFQMYGDSDQNRFQPTTVTWHLTILDPANQDVLWTNSTFNISDDLKPLLPTKSAPRSGKEFALLPAQLKHPNKLFIQPMPPPQPPEDTDAAAAFSQAILKSGSYTLVDAPEQADLILSFSVTNLISPFTHAPRLGSVWVSILDPATRTILWTFDNEFVSANKITVDKQIRETVPYVVQSWNGIIGKDSFSCHIQIVGATCSFK